MTPIPSSPAATALRGRIVAPRSAGSREDRASPAAVRPRFTLETPDGERIVATGMAARFDYEGGDAFHAVRSWLAALAASARVEGLEPDCRVDDPLVAIVVFPFETRGEAGDLGSTRAWIPERFERRDSSGRLHALEWASNEPPAPYPAARAARADEWTREGWTRAVEASLERIRSGALRKVVLSRSRVVRGVAAYDTDRIFHALNESYPECYRFRYESGDGSVFLGASPERLVALRRGLIEAEAVAGTSANGSGALLDDPKETLEHDIVVQDVLAALRPVADRLDADPVPSTQRLRHVTHLRTRVRAAARPGAHVLDLASRIHPSSAVAGSPRDAALEHIRSLEPAPRGWYAGPIGWASAGGEGELTLGLRAALTLGADARLQAGAGIVTGSDPDREWDECESKMRAMEEALRG